MDKFLLPLIAFLYLAHLGCESTGNNSEDSNGRIEHQSQNDLDESYYDSLAVASYYDFIKGMGLPDLRKSTTTNTIIRLFTPTKHLGGVAYIFTIENNRDQIHLAFDHLIACHSFSDTVKWYGRFTFQNKWHGELIDFCYLERSELELNTKESDSIKYLIRNFNPCDYHEKLLPPQDRPVNSRKYFIERIDQGHYCFQLLNGKPSTNSKFSELVFILLDKKESEESNNSHRH